MRPTHDEGWTVPEEHVRTRKIAFNGIEIHYDETGEGERPLVLIHGYTGHRTDFREVLSEAVGLGRLVAPDLRGHGDATPTGDASTCTFGQLVDDLRALLDGLKIESCDLLGHSMGGMVALRFVLGHPERVASLIAMDTSPDLPVEISSRHILLLGALARNEGMEAAQRRVEEAARRTDGVREADPYVQRWGGRYWPHHRMRYRAMDPEAYASFGQTMCEQSPVTDRLGEIHCPTMVLVGEGDSAFLPGSSALAKGIPGARLVVIPDAGHHPHQENPRAWWAAVRSHLDLVR
jgi:pimeloyl-ACP methyl ester carboxylesterase